MIIDTSVARREWSERVLKQARELRAIAGVTRDVAMRSELLNDASRLDLLAAEIDGRTALDRLKAAAR